MVGTVWLLLVLSSGVPLPPDHSLIETYQLFDILRSPAPDIHLLEVNGISETDVELLQKIPTAKSISIRDLSDPSKWPLMKAPRQEDFVLKMKAYGIKLDSTMVVLYDRSGLLFAAKAWWLLTVFGRDFVKVLNGGLPKWTRDGYPINPAEPQVLLDPASQDSLSYGYKLDLKRMWSNSDVDSLSAMLTSPVTPEPVQLLDVRSKAEFDASSVKGSINMPIDIVRRADGTLRVVRELNVIFQNYGVRTNNETLTVVMGLNGVDSSMALLSLSVVGYDHSAMVDGGWLGYSNWLKNSVGMATTDVLEIAPATSEDGTAISHGFLYMGICAVLVGAAMGVIWVLKDCMKDKLSKKAYRKPLLDFSEKWL